MQNKGAIKFFAVAFALVCLFQLSFTFMTSRVEKAASEYANNDAVLKIAKDSAKGNTLKEKLIFDSLIKVRENYYLDSMANEEVYNFLWVRKYTYKECKEREVNLGLDLKGGMNVTLEISVSDIVRAMSNYSKDATFNKAITDANEMQKNSQKDFVTLFGEAFAKADPNAKLSAIFNTVEYKDKINYNSTNEEVLSIIRTESNDAIDRTFNILRTRIDRFGVTQPNIQKLSTAGRILVELPGIKDPKRVRKLLQGTAKLEFWETYEFADVYTYLEAANKKLGQLAAGNTDSTEVKDSTKTDSKALAKKDKKDSAKEAKDTSSLVNKIKSDSTKAGDLKAQQSFEEYAKENPLFAYLKPAFDQKDGKYFYGKGPTVGYTAIIDTSKVNLLLKMDIVKNILPRDLKLLWEVKPFDEKKTTLRLIAIKVTNRDGKAPLEGDAITDARQDFSQSGSNEISMSMNSEGAKIWKRLTGEHIGEAIAIVLDNYVYSAPTVQSEIPNGSSQITGNFTLEEAKDLANILKAGKLPASARIVEEAIVGPSLGQEAIDSGMMSFIIAFCLVLIYMAFYYNKAGLVADIALFTNIFFLFGVLASLGAVLTLPGIAGIVLTMGMAVDANVIIYERIREEVRAGKGIRLAIHDGYQNAYSAIIDGNLTTLITGIVLYVFGTGPVQGFATTLIIGIITSLFSAIFISRLIFEWMLNKNMKITFDTKLTKNAFSKVNIDFIGIRKKLYIVSAIIITIGIISLSTKGLKLGVDFSGGHSYVVRFDQDIKTNDIRKTLEKEFGDVPEVKIFGPDNQVKITTKYMIDDPTNAADSIIETKLYSALKSHFKKQLTFDDFSTKNSTIGVLSSQKVGPTIADDIKVSAVWAIVVSLLAIFLYIAVRFRKWQYGLGGVVSLFHDSLITISMYSIFYGILPFNLELDQAFIAAILTIIGYSINDTVIIFDRIREYRALYPKRELNININQAINSTLGRTFNTAGTTLVTLLAIFILGGESLRGFVFALLIGIAVGTYSSIFNATPVAYDFIMMRERKEKKKEKKLKK